MPKLPFISDEDFIEAVKQLLDAAGRAKQKAAKNPYKNVIDPFSALIDAAYQGISLNLWMEQEKARQMQKSLQNAIGDFHQNILGAMPGWENAGKGGSYDVINDERKILAELKNKHNTMNSTSGTGTYDKLAKWLDYGKEGYTAYAVAVVPKKPEKFVVPFRPSERKIRRPERNDLLAIDGRSFYGLAAGREDAIDLVYKALPDAISSVIKIDDEVLRGTEAFYELFEKAYISK